MQFLPCGTHPDYRSNMPGAAVAGRAIVPEPFDGRLLGSDFKRLRAADPGIHAVRRHDVRQGRHRAAHRPLPSLGNFLHAAKLFARYFADRLRYPRGTRLTMGNALVGRLYYSLRKRNVPILFDATIVELIGDRDGVTGARSQVGGKEIVVKARKGVVLATGGYGHNKRFREAFMPQPVPAHSMSFAGNQRRRPRARRKARRAHRARALHQRAVDAGLDHPARRRQQGPFPHFMLDRAKPGLIAVNAAGRRFVNEAVLLSRLRAGDVREPTRIAPTIPAWLDLRRRLHQEIRPRHRLSRPPATREVRAQRLSQARRHAR